jgi:hypothetical protein
MNIDTTSKIDFSVTQDETLITFGFIDGTTLNPIGGLRISKVHADAFLSALQTVFRTYHGALEINTGAITRNESGLGTIEFRDA